MKFQTRTSFAMAVLSTLVYCLPIRPQSFRIIQRVRPTGRMRRLLCQAHRFFRRLWWTMTMVRQSQGPPHGDRTCPQSLRWRASIAYRFQYWFKDWKEPTIVPGIRYHETDLLVVQRRNDIILVFSGTGSPTDHATNLQTFEKISHAGIFPGKYGSIHRGFLNAYSRVDRGIVYSYTNSSRNVNDKRLNDILLPMFRNCTFMHDETSGGRQDWVDSSVNGTGEPKVARNLDVVFRRLQNGGCRIKGSRLRHILIMAVQKALLKGRRVHIAGHSLGTCDSASSFPLCTMLIHHEKHHRRWPCYHAGA
jgi:hypothetical protein